MPRYCRRIHNRCPAEKTEFISYILLIISCCLLVLVGYSVPFVDDNQTTLSFSLYPFSNLAILISPITLIVIKKACARNSWMKNLVQPVYKRTINQNNRKPFPNTVKGKMPFIEEPLIIHETKKSVIQWITQVHSKATRNVIKTLLKWIIVEIRIICDHISDI